MTYEDVTVHWLCREYVEARVKIINKLEQNMGALSESDRQQLEQARAEMSPHMRCFKANDVLPKKLKNWMDRSGRKRLLSEFDMVGK